MLKTTSSPNKAELQRLREIDRYLWYIVGVQIAKESPDIPPPELFMDFVSDIDPYSTYGAGIIRYIAIFEILKIHQFLPTLKIEDFHEILTWAWKNGLRPMLGKQMVSATTPLLITKEVPLSADATEADMRTAFIKAVALAAGYEKWFEGLE